MASKTATASATQTIYLASGGTTITSEVGLYPTPTGVIPTGSWTAGSGTAMNTATFSAAVPTQTGAAVGARGGMGLALGAVGLVVALL